MDNEKLVELEHLKDILPIFEQDVLSKAQDMIPKTVEPMYDDVPSIFLKGEMPTDKTYVPIELEYKSQTECFKSFTYAKLQGTSTLNHPKKNFTIALYQNEERNHPLYKNFKGWGKSNKFVLKADYNDILHARNVVCAKLWSKVVASRPDYNELPEELRNSPNNGAIDGFPVKVYINGEYHGLYCLTIPKGAWQFGLNENNETHALISAQINDNGSREFVNNPCNFNVAWDDGTYKDAWEIEVGNDRATIQGSFNQVQSRVASMNTVDISNYLDLQSVVDYYIFQNVILGTDGLAKNMLMVTYDMQKWYLSAYDMDSTFGLSWEGKLLGGYNTYMPNEPYLNRNSVLYLYTQRLLRNSMKTRYFELRNTVLSEASIIGLFDEYVSIYGDDLYIQDTIMYPNIPNAIENNISYLRNFIIDRLAFLDENYGR